MHGKPAVEHVPVLPSMVYPALHTTHFPAPRVTQALQLASVPVNVVNGAKKPQHELTRRDAARRAEIAGSTLEFNAVDDRFRAADVVPQATVLVANNHAALTA